MEDLCREAETLLTTGSPNAALVIANEVLAQTPTSRRARRLRARALLDLRKNEQALADLALLAGDPVSDPNEWYDVLALAQAIGSSDLVEAAVDELEKSGDISPEAMLDAADAAYLDGDLDTARERVQQAATVIAKSGASDAEVQVWNARLDAIEALDDHRAFVLGTAEALLRRDRPTDALEQLSSLADGADEASDADHKISALAGCSLLRLGRFTEAANVLRRSHAVQPDNPSITLDLATALHLTGEHELALELCEEVLSHDDSVISARVLACESGVALGEIERARKHAREALAFAPDDATIWHAWSGVLAASGDVETARVAADHALVLDPGLVAAWQRGAETLERLDQPALAAHYRAEATVQGADGPIVDRRDLSEVNSTNIDDARRWTSVPDTDYVGRDRFQIALALGLNALAKTYADWLIGVEPDPHGDLAAVRGFLLLQSGDLAAAETSFRKALGTDPNHERATAGLASIARIGAPPLPERPPPVAPAQPPPTHPPRTQPVPAPPLPTQAPTVSSAPAARRNEVSLAKRLAVWASILLGIASSIFVLVTLLRGDDRTAAPESTPTTIAVTSTLASTSTSTAPTTSLPPATTAPDDPFAPQFFASPEEALTDWLSLVEPPYAGTCETLAGQEAALGGSVTCAIYDHNVGLAEVYRWGVFATDDHRGWILVDVGSAGWSVADETFEATPPW